MDGNLDEIIDGSAALAIASPSAGKISVFIFIRFIVLSIFKV